MPDPPLHCPFLPSPAEPLDYRILSAHGPRRDAEFYFDALRYGHHLWLQRHSGRALLALARALYADVSASAEVLKTWPLPYAALRWIVESHSGDDFPGNPRISFQHQACRLRGPRAEQRRARAWAAWALVRKARPNLPGDPSLDSEEPSLATIAAALEQYGHPGERVRWQSVLAHPDH